MPSCICRLRPDRRFQRASWSAVTGSADDHLAWTMIGSALVRLASGVAVLGVFIGAGTPAMADAPRGIMVGTVCSLNGHFCSIRNNARSVEIYEKLGKSRRRIWRAGVIGPHLAISDDGRSVVEFKPGLNLVDRNAGAGTIVLIFHRPGLPITSLRLHDLSIDPHRMPSRYRIASGRVHLVTTARTVFLS